MVSLNKVMLVGNLTRDPEVRYLPSNQPVADLRLAVNRRYKSSTGEDREETCFVTVAVWGKQAEACKNYLAKGAPVMVEGHLRYEEWERDGQKQNRISVVAERVQFMNPPRRGEVGSGGDSGGEPARGARPENREIPRSPTAAPTPEADEVDEVPGAREGDGKDREDLPF